MGRISDSNRSRNCRSPAIDQTLKIGLKDFRLSDLQDEEFARSLAFAYGFFCEDSPVEQFVPGFLVGSISDAVPENLPSRQVLIEMPIAIVQTLGIREAGGQSPLEILKKNLQDSLRAPMLLLLDNFEHLIQAAPTVAELLAMGPNLKILVTSRAALHVYGEHEFPVPPLRCRIRGPCLRLRSCRSTLRSRCSCSAPSLPSRILN